ncbi:hypothetical protein VH569_13285 [Azospirillum sp. 11R-A]|uniref:hypothetical protein n=1 Tax=Azospirillum sp. 11R-A TaxID=3111634 RepID=UPI003C1665CF
MPVPFHAGDTIALTVPGQGASDTHTVSRRVLVWRQKGDRVDCVLSDQDGGLALASIAPAGAGRWSCLGVPAAIGTPPPRVR